MAINQISTANTFEEWLTTTSTLVAVANNLTNNTSGGFVMNSSIFIEGSSASLNVRTLANINQLTVNTISILGGSVNGNLSTVNVSSNLYVGQDAYIYGNLVISGNVTLDSLGFDDLSVAGSVNSTNLNTETANISSLTGNSNTAIYSTITAAIDSSIAFAIALG